MAFNGSGTFSLYSTGNPVVTNTTISSSWANSTLQDIATNGLTYCITKDGQQTITANIPMSGFKFTGLGAGSASGNSLRYEQVNGLVTTAGDVLYATGAGTLARLGVGTAGYPLRVNSGATAPEWSLTDLLRVSVYKHTAWDPSDMVGTLTNASATAAATSAATSYLTVANSSGTTTWTNVKAGLYRFCVSMQNELAAIATLLRGEATIGGSATLLLPAAGSVIAPIYMESTFGGNTAITGSVEFYAVMTAAQTVTVLPKIGVVSGGVTTNFTTQCMISAEYVGTT